MRGIKQQIKEVVIEALSTLQSDREASGKGDVYIQPYVLFRMYHHLIHERGIDDECCFPGLDKFMAYIYNLSVEQLENPADVQIVTIRFKEQQLDGKTYTYHDRIFGYAIPRPDSELTSDYIFHDYQYHLVDEMKRKLLNGKRLACMQAYVDGLRTLKATL